MNLLQIEKLNADYLKIINSKEYKLGSIFTGIADGIKSRNTKKIHKNITLLWQGIRLQKYNSPKERYRTIPYHYASNEKTAVYTALFGGYDMLCEPVITDENCDYFIFTDQKISTDSRWKKLNLSDKELLLINNLTNTEKNRYFKMTGYNRFSDYKYSIYLDANLEIYGELSKLTAYVHNPLGLALYNHPARDCIYNEARACVILGKAKKRETSRLVSKYRQLGMPTHYGMCECGVIVRENANQKCRELMDAWWREFKDSPVKRDQLLFPFILWKSNIKMDDVGCLGENIGSSGKFRIKSHSRNI